MYRLLGVTKPTFILTNSHIFIYAYTVAISVSFNIISRLNARND